MKGLATCVAIICAPCGSRFTSCSASQPYKRLANGTKHTSTTTTQAIALIRRERSSSRCEKMPCSMSKPESFSDPGSCSGVAIARLLRDGGSAVLRRVGRVRDFRDGTVHGRMYRMHFCVGRLAHCVGAIGGLLCRAPDLFHLEFALDLAAHAFPAEA